MQTLEKAYEIRLNEKKKALAEQSAKLDALSPLKTLTRGYSIAVDNDGNVLKDVSNFTSECDFTLKLHDGDVACRVK